MEKCTLNNISKEANKKEKNKLKNLIKVFFSAKIIFDILVPLFLVQQTLVRVIIDCDCLINLNFYNNNVGNREKIFPTKEAQMCKCLLDITQFLAVIPW